jgi:sirohydrochlorin ferrochelatase
MDAVAAALTLASPPAMATSLLLVVHGRAGGVIPQELESLAAALAQRRGAPVWLQALTAASPAALPRPLAQAGGELEQTLTLVPLMLLPGGHVRQDIPAIARHWSAMAGVDRIKRVAFVGAWPAWQQALAAEVRQLQAAAATGAQPLLLHHPLEGPLAPRYLEHLSAVSGARLRATPYSAEQLTELQLSLTAPALPLALAANRLTDVLEDRVGPPLLQRPRFCQVLLEQLGGLP